MRNGILFRLLSLFLVFLLVQSTAFSLFAADDDKPHLSGRVFDPDKDDPDKKHPLADVKVRIVRSETGESRDTITNKSGCYDFDDVTPGTYSLAVNHEDVDFLLQDKIKVEPNVNLMACVALQYQNNSLVLVTDKHCKCHGFPWLFLVLGTAPAAAFLLIHEEGPEEASPSSP